MQSDLSSVSKRNLPVFIVEDHNDVLPCLHRLIGRKCLPLSNITMVHFDSHSDLSVPANLTADKVFIKDELYSNVSIESWLIPLVYAGHVSSVVWVKPFWTLESMTTSSVVAVGAHKSTGQIKITSTDNYFLSELSYSPEEELENCKWVKLEIVTLGYESLCDCCPGGDEQAENFKQQTLTKSEQRKAQQQPATGAVSNSMSCRKDVEAGECFTRDSVREENSELVQPSSSPQSRANKSELSDVETASGVINSLFVSNDTVNGFVLDIDLDFFSTTDPFRSTLTNEQRQLLLELYRFEPPADQTVKSINQCVQQRQDQIQYLKSVFSSVQAGQIPQLTDAKRDLLLKKLLHTIAQPVTNTDEVQCCPSYDYEWLHEIGTGIDDCSLPHHVSSDAEVSRLITRVENVLQRIPRPRAITIARSSADSYCPPEQVDSIQAAVLEMLHKLYGQLNVQVKYDVT